MTQTASLAQELDTPYPLRPDQIEQYRTEGFIKLKNVLSAEVIEYYGKEITDQVFRLNNLIKPMSERTTYEKAFLQIPNLWTKSEIVKEFAFSKRLAKIAADLMQVDGVRMYHDQALYKEPGGGFTPWHADQYYWPLNTNNTTTVWIPLQETPKEMGPLAFSVGSQNYTKGRDMAISDESEKKISKALLEQGLPQVDSAFDLGEVSFHSGWTYHRAGPNTTANPRKTFTIIYMQDGMRLIEPQSKAHQNDWNGWLPGARVGEVIDTPLNPVLYSRRA
jgi:ectoine hydroxylase-related dioxygenase (phytanoyl-CoA dioxygenase family)